MLKTKIKLVQKKPAKRSDTPPDLLAIAQYINRYGLRGWLIRELGRAYTEARKNKRLTHNEHDFEIRHIEYLSNLASAILEEHYHPSSSIAFIIFEPMIREIFAAPFIDRVVHHLLYYLNAAWWDRRFISDSYSCRRNRGTLYGVLRIQKMMRKATLNGTRQAYYLKLDIRGYFMSLSREKLLERVEWGLRQQYGPYMWNPAVRKLYQLNHFLWKKVLLDDPASKARRRGPGRDWARLPATKSLFAQLAGIGIVIGNLTSQLVSNIFLDQLDRFIKYELGYKHYGRYVDDFIIIVPANEVNRLKADIPRIAKFLEDLGLTLHPTKRSFQSVYKGLTFLGVRISPFCLYPSDRLQAKVTQAIANLGKGTTTYETLNSYFGLLSHLDADKFVRRLFRRYGIDFSLYREWMVMPRERSTKDIIAEMRAQAINYRREHQNKQ